MEIQIKRFNELTINELYEMLKLRSEVFVVEQNCAYQDIDDKDQHAIHISLVEDGVWLAYLRVLDKGVSYDTASLGRVITRARGKGLGLILMKEGIKVVKEVYKANELTISAQCQAVGFYEKLGFEIVSEPYLEDDIPHVKMKLLIK